MDPNLKIAFGLIGGLALFLYGMNGMSDSLQKVAGERMKKILGLLTKNPVFGALAGMLVTAVLQSSSATTVMVIGFVSARLMTLPQAISVIFGANIGTTMTAQLMAFKLSNYIYPIIFAGFLMNFIAKTERVKNIGLVVFNFGLLFEGIEIMGHVMKPLATSPLFVDLMGQVANTPILGLLLGAGMTIVVQSSSATIAVLQNFASQAGPDGVSSVIGLTGAIPILLGDNIGTTITALLACIGQSKNAQRTAVAHSVFNISGSIVFLCIIPFFAQFVAWISPKGPELEIIARQIANAHTAFNITATLIWLPLIPVMVKIVRFIIRGEDGGEKPSYEPHFLDDKVLSQPTAAMYLVSKELNHLSRLSAEMIDHLREYISDRTDAASEQFCTGQKGVKNLQSAVSSYITHLFSRGGLTDQQAAQSSGLLFVTSHIGHIADSCLEVHTIADRARRSGKNLSSAAVDELEKCLEVSRKMFSQSIRAVNEGSAEAARCVTAENQELRQMQKQYYRSHIDRVHDNSCHPEFTADYASLLYAVDRMADNCVGIAEEAMEHASFVHLRNQSPQTAK